MNKVEFFYLSWLDIADFDECYAIKKENNSLIFGYFNYGFIVKYFGHYDLKGLSDDDLPLHELLDEWSSYCEDEILFIEEDLYNLFEIE